MALRVLISAGTILLLLFIAIRLLEGHLIWFPSRTLSGTPADMGIDYEDVLFRTDDDVELHGWLTAHPDPKGVILVCHGNAGNISHRMGTLARFHRMGLRVFLFDYRGYGKSQGSVSEAGTYRDVRAAYRHLVVERGIQPDRIVLFGRSLGAGVIADAAVESPAAGVILESGFTSTRDMGRVLYPYLPV